MPDRRRVSPLPVGHRQQSVERIATNVPDGCCPQFYPQPIAVPELIMFPAGNKMKSVRSSLVKAPTGIAGFDEITGGGLPRGRATLLVGGPGSGKTILALQFLVHGVQDCKEPDISGANPASDRQPQ
jgi:hypothetical protein